MSSQYSIVPSEWDLAVLTGRKISYQSRDKHHADLRRIVLLCNTYDSHRRRTSPLFTASPPAPPTRPPPPTCASALSEPDWLHIKSEEDLESSPPPYEGELFTPPDVNVSERELDSSSDSDSDSDDDDRPGPYLWTDDEESSDQDSASDTSCSDDEHDEPRMSLERTASAMILSLTAAEAQATIFAHAQGLSEKAKGQDDELDLGLMPIQDVEERSIQIPPPRNPRRNSMNYESEQKAWKKPLSHLVKSFRSIVT